MPPAPDSGGTACVQSTGKKRGHTMSFVKCCRLCCARVNKTEFVWSAIISVIYFMVDIISVAGNFF